MGPSPVRRGTMVKISHFWQNFECLPLRNAFCSFNVLKKKIKKKKTNKQKKQTNRHSGSATDYKTQQMNNLWDVMLLKSTVGLLPCQRRYDGVIAHAVDGCLLTPLTTPLTSLPLPEMNHLWGVMLFNQLYCLVCEDISRIVANTVDSWFLTPPPKPHHTSTKIPIPIPPHPPPANELPLQCYVV